MSVAGKKPFVNKIIERCSKTRVSRIMSLLNNFGEPTLLSLYGSENALSDANKGVSYVTFKLEEVNAKTVNGILVYIDSDNCGLFAFNDDTGITGEFKIDPVHKTYTQIFEHLTVEELRQICGDRVADIEVGSIQAEDIDSETTPAGKVLTANGQGGASWGEKITDYLKKTEGARVWVTNQDYDTLENDSTGLLNKLKAGDIIYSDAAVDIAFVSHASTVQVDIMHNYTDGVDFFSYTKLENSWELYSNYDYLFGTKLYKHELDFSVLTSRQTSSLIQVATAMPITIISTNSTAFNLNISSINGINCISIANDDGVSFATISYDINTNSIILRTGLIDGNSGEVGIVYEVDSQGYFLDDVTPL